MKTSCIWQILLRKRVDIINEINIRVILQYYGKKNILDEYVRYQSIAKSFSQT